ncbi:MAG: hypothetical protein IH614_00255 [Desulfuromonadales bacterium]|nr:hypothetical protein [Desulfuromonadales bacterium]
MERILQTVMVLIIATILLLAAREMLLAAEGGGGAPNPVRGTVVEILAGGGYTYLHLEEEGRRRWAAIPQADVKIGQKVELVPGVAMGKFTSKVLGRTFDEIYFSSGLVGAAGKPPHPQPSATAPGGLPPGHPMMGMGGGRPAMAAAPAETGVAIAGTVAETMDAGGYTYVRVTQKEAAKEAKATWVAVPKAKLAVGSQVSFAPGATMENFTSKTLNRTFESIIFSSGLR